MRFIILLVTAFLSAVIFSACSLDDKGSDKSPTETNATLTFRLTDVENTELAGNLACTFSIPAQCNGELKCPATETAEKKACAYLFKNEKELFTPVDPMSACTMIFGGPEKATVSGTVNGKEKTIDLSRSGGCEIANWDLHQPLWS